MLRSRASRIAALLVVLPGWTAIAAAGTLTWIALDPPLPEPGKRVAVRLLRGEPGAGVERAFRSGPGVRLQQLWKGGRANLGIEGGSPAARILPTTAGVHLVAYDITEGTTEHHAKALLVVQGSPRGSPLHWSELGQRLEIVPQTDPVELVERGGELELQLLWEREPLADATVTAIPQGAPDGSRRAVTDEIGVATLRLTAAGPWLVWAERRDAAGTRVVATLVLQAGPVRR